jgi:selenide,water dikinase
MLEASNAGAVIRRYSIPVWQQAVPLANDGVYPGGLESNKKYLRGRVQPDGVSEDDLLPLYDPQTSGGLLIAVPESRASRLLRDLEERGVTGAGVGEVTEEPGIKVTG